ncbi:FMN-binding protein [Lagierella sp.]|uniref:FMN-binding protein n=1 Tax=Lagierella sp. TaxID=2849657 RepID=UPI00262B7B1E|nr:FMN-binding protein [Lagierella sp.]
MKKRCKILLSILLVLIAFTGCKKIKKAGTYEAFGKGRNGEIKVSVTIDSEGEISDIELMDYEDNKEFIEKAFPEIREKILEEKKIEVDTVTGATQSSKGIIEAVKEAVKQSEKE